MDMLTRVFFWENPAIADTTESGVEDKEGSRVLELIALIRKSIAALDKKQLGEDLNNLSAIFQVQRHEKTELIYNQRIRKLLGQLKSSSPDFWDRKIVVTKPLRNTKNVAIEDIDIHITPSIDLIMDQTKPVPRGFNNHKPNLDRELMLLRIYGIDSGVIRNILLNRE